MLLRYIYFIFLLLIISFTARAQLCKGSLGDPIITIDFGSGTTRFGPELPAGTTTYTYVNGVPDDGYYTLTNTTANIIPAWFATTDHTGNAGGYMMLVNGSFTPQVFYTRQIDGLCSGTTYEFAAWIINLLTYPANRPNITFTIKGADGTLLGSYNTGNIPETTTPTWKQYGLQFTMPANQSSVIVTMTNTGPGGLGNDLALDDITFRPCGPVVVAKANTATDLDACSNQNLTLNLSATDGDGYDHPVYQWQVNSGNGWTDISGATALTAQVHLNQPAAGTYQYRLATGEAANFASVQCRVVSNTTTVTVHTAPVAAAANSGPACVGSTVTLSASGGDNYSWTGPNNFTSTLQSPVISNATEAASGVYQVTVSSADCRDVASTTVLVKPLVTADAGSNVSICQGSAVTLQASGGSFYNWSPSKGLSNTTVANPVASPSVTTTYTVQVSNGVCMQTDSVTITVVKNATAYAGADTSLITGQSIQLKGAISGDDVTYYWTPEDYLSNSHSLTPVANPPSTITYTLHAISAHCTSASSSVEVLVLNKLTIPNTITPNGDGINDVWNINGLDTYPHAHVQIFSRSGTKVFESTGYPYPWDGRYNGQELPIGTYYYVIDFRNTRPPLSGWIFISR